MATFLAVVKVIAIIIVVFFVLTFLIYIFNLDMKMLAKMKPMFMKIYEKRKKERKI